MKKLMFSALACVAFAFSGFASNEVVNEVVNENEVINENEFINEELSIDDTITEFDAPCKNWVTVNRSCGGQFYLCSDNYGSFEELINRARQYDSVQCNGKGLAPTNTGTGLSNF